MFVANRHGVVNDLDKLLTITLNKLSSHTSQASAAQYLRRENRRADTKLRSEHKWCEIVQEMYSIMRFVSEVLIQRGIYVHVSLYDQLIVDSISVNDIKTVSAEFQKKYGCEPCIYVIDL